MKRTTLIIFLLLLIASHTFCQKKEPVDAAVETVKPLPDHKYLVGATTITTINAQAIQERSALPQELRSQIKNDIIAYKVTYRTKDVDGTTINASGALVMPHSGNKASPLLSIQHGTIFTNEEAPSNWKKSYEASSFGVLMASSGHIVSVPDYIGYGASKDRPHPYQHAHSLASASLDMLRAVLELCEALKVDVKTDLFLTGYSEGGYATLALMRKIEHEAHDEFNIVACAPGAGAYNITRFSKHVLSASTPLRFINTYIWVLSEYDRIYGLKRGATFYYNEPFASEIRNNNMLKNTEVSPKQLFKASFSQAVLKEKDAVFASALQDNDIYDWAPKAPLMLIHGTDDDYVPFFNSQDAYEAMKKRGAQQIKLVPLTGKDHSSAFYPYLQKVISYFHSFD